MAHMRVFGLVVPFMWLPVAGCGNDAAGGEGEAEAEGGQACADDSECPPGLTCIDGFCDSVDGGTTDGPAGLAQITVDPTLLDFGAPLIGSETTLTATIFNTGGSALTILGITLVEEEDPDLANEYTMSEETYPYPIEPGQNRVIEVTLRPEDGEADVGYLEIRNTDPDPLDQVKRVDLFSEIKGDPVLDLCVLESFPPPGDCETIDELDFGAVPFSGSSTRVFSLANLGDGNRTIEISDVDLDDDHFVTDVSCADGVCDLFEWDGTAEVPLADGLPYLLRPADMKEPIDPEFAEPNRLYVRVTFTPSIPPPIDGLVPEGEDAEVETSLEPPDEVVEIPFAGTIVGCRPGYFDGDGDPSNGCEYECTPSGVSETLCNGVDDNCVDGSDEDYAPYECGVGGCIRTSTCIGGVEDCTPGVEDNDDDCDGVDDDCNGVADDDWVATTCGLGICTATSTCVAGVGSCVPGPVGTETCNGGVDDDCDGSADEEDPGDSFEGGAGCPAAVSIGSVNDAAGDSLIASGVIHEGDEDWYSVAATDDAAEGCGAGGDEFDFRVCWVTNPAADLRFDVHLGSCPPAASSCTSVPDVAQWDFTCPDGTDCCSGAGATGVDIGATFYIRVYREPGEPVDCGTYTFKVANGGAPCP